MRQTKGFLKVRLKSLIFNVYVIESNQISAFVYYVLGEVPHFLQHDKLDNLKTFLSQSF